MGYVTGSGDEVFKAIRQMGLSFLLSETDLTSGGLFSQTIVAGIRAFQVRQNLTLEMRACYSKRENEFVTELDFRLTRVVEFEMVFERDFIFSCGSIIFTL